MKTNSPVVAPGGEVFCPSCPLENLDRTFCHSWGRFHSGQCPTMETYQAACELAERVEAKR